MKAKFVLAALFLVLAGPVMAATDFLGGDFTDPANWTNGLPGNGNDGTMNVDGNDGAGTPQGTSWVASTPTTITVGGGAVIDFGEDLRITADVTLIVNNATINCADDAFTGAGNLILNPGSSVNSSDDFKPSNGAGFVTIYGGTHTTGDQFSSNSGAEVNVLGGTITAGTYNFVSGSPVTLGGTAVLLSGSSSTGLTMAGTLDIQPDWSGSWQVASFVAGDWETTLAGTGWTLDGIAIDAQVFADNFVVSEDGTTLSLVPAFAHDPVPAIGTTAVELSQTLGWTTGLTPVLATNTDITKHYLYVLETEVTDVDPNMPNATMTTVTGVDPSGVASPVTLNPDKRYYWRVDESVLDSAPEDAATITGPLWYFDTVKSFPIVDAGPVATAVFPTETAQFSVEFTSISSLTASAWEFSADGGATWTNAAGSITLDEASTPKTCTLTISGVSEAQEGLYRCVLTNGGGDTISDAAGLTVKRKVAHYAFDNTLADSVYGNDGVAANTDPNATPDVTYTSGVFGNALLVNPATDPAQSYVELPLTAYPNSNVGGGLKAGTIIAWVKSENTGVVMGGLNDGYNTGFTVDINSQLKVLVRGEGAVNNQSIVDYTLADGTWKFIAARWEVGGENRAYAGSFTENGDSSAVGNGPASAAYAAWQYPMVIGGVNNRGTVQPVGNVAVDDIQIYNYPLTENEIIAVYNAVTGNRICVNEYATGFDFNDDCSVDLADFAAFAASWLSTGLSSGQ